MLITALNIIRDITYASSRFGEESSMDSWNSAAWIGENKTWLTVRMEFVAPNFLSFWGIRIKEGEGFKDTTSYRALVNETFMKEYGLKDPFSVNYSGHRVKGVMYDFNYFTAQYAIQPLILSVMENRSDVYSDRTFCLGRSLELYPGKHTTFRA